MDGAFESLARGEVPAPGEEGEGHQADEQLRQRRGEGTVGQRGHPSGQRGQRRPGEDPAHGAQRHDVVQDALQVREDEEERHAAQAHDEVRLVLAQRGRAEGAHEVCGKDCERERERHGDYERGREQGTAVRGEKDRAAHGEDDSEEGRNDGAGGEKQGPRERGAYLAVTQRESPQFGRGELLLPRRHHDGQQNIHGDAETVDDGEDVKAVGSIGKIHVARQAERDQAEKSVKPDEEGQDELLRVGVQRAGPQCAVKCDEGAGHCEPSPSQSSEASSKSPPPTRSTKTSVRLRPSRTSST